MTWRDRILRGGRRRAMPGGFTLLELLVALALMGLIAVVLAGGLRFGARVWEASRDASDSLGEIAAVRGFIRERAMSVRPLRLRRPDGGVTGTLSGGRSDLRFVTLMPSYVSRGGLHHLALSAAGGGGLRLAWWPVGSSEDGPGSGRRELLAGATGLELSYFGAPGRGDGVAWREDWPDRQGLPRLISIKVRFPDDDPRVWPELIVFLPAAATGLRPTRGPGRELVP
ncbi:MAG: prepilin-type N-terminal cleavage/methylation domain-containing protein [Alphaproteobacteria bacterium]|nr:prepilin-type N-terminal cleavage/methylation domain-containing protein [Alphaproteobacteria bacterium]